MKSGTFYAKRVKRLFSKLRQEHGTVQLPEPSDPVDALVLGLLTREAPPSNASRARESLFQAMVDYNEVRVSTIAEIRQQIQPHVPNASKRADAIRRALNAVYRKQHRICLESLRKLGRREARQYLEKLDGVDAHAAAYVILWSLGGHAVPVDLPMFERMRQDDLVEPSATIDEVQAFLERNIAASDAREFCLLMRRYVDAAAASRPGSGGEGKGASGKSSKARRGWAGAKTRSSRKKSAKSTDQSTSC